MAPVKTINDNDGNSNVIASVGTNDADRLARAPALRLVVSQRASGKQAAARNTIGRLTNGFQHGSRNDSATAPLTAAPLLVDSGRQSHHRAAPHL